MGFACPGLGQVGNPIILNYTPSDYVSDNQEYVSSPQNFDILEDSRGVLFIANSSEILVFDGQTWSNVKGSGDLRLYKLAADEKGKIYSGGKQDLGFIDVDSAGAFWFHSMKEMLPDSVRNFERISRVVSYNGLVYFLDSKYLFIWDGSRFEVLKSSTTFFRIFETASGIWVTDKTGLFIIKSGKDNLELMSKDLPGPTIRAIFSYPEVASPEVRLLLITEKDGLFMFNGEEVTKIASRLDNEKVYNASLLTDNKIAVGTNGSGIFIMDFDGNITSIIDESTGLQQGQVLYPKQGSDSEILAALFSGVSRIEHSPSISLFDKRNGINTIALKVLESNSTKLIGTLKNCFLLSPPSSVTGSTNAQELSVPMEEIQDMITVGDKILLGTAAGLYSVSTKFDVTPIPSLKKITFIYRSKVDTNRIYIGNQARALSSIYFQNGKWIDEGFLDTLEHPTYNFVETPEGDLWASYNSASFIDFENGFGTPHTVLTLDSANGVTPEMSLIEVTEVNGKIVFGTKIGIYRFDASTRKLVPDYTYGEDFANGKRLAYNLTSTRNGDVWVTTNRQTGILRRQPDNTYIYDSLPIIRAPISDVFSIYEDPEGVMWFGGTEALVRYDPRIPKDYHQPFYALVRKVTLNGDSTIFYGNYADANGYTVTQQPESFYRTLPFSLNHLTFEFSAPFFEAPEKIEYSIQLVGQDKDWSPWGKDTKAEYTNLHEGRYTFRVKARNVYGTISYIGEYSFRILPPWYRTIWAFIAYAALAVLILILAVRFYTRRLIRAKNQLEIIVDERTAEIAKQNKEIQAEMKKSEDLLLNILPKEIADELKSKPSVEPKGYKLVSVLFADISGFTQLSETLKPRELVDELHACFSELDNIIESHGLEKIKTIGDAYMCAGGLPTEDPDNPRKVVQAALDIQACMARLNEQKVKEGKPPFELRIGVHSGPVVAGIVGTRKYQYDIWGDTVNTAARMETTSEPGRVNISGFTYDLVKDYFTCSYRGLIKAKNKGEIAMYFVEGKAQKPS